MPRKKKNRWDVKMRNHFALALAFLLAGCLMPRGERTHMAETPTAHAARESRYQRSPQTPGAKYVLVWMDAMANFERLANCARIEKVLDKCVNAGVSGVALEVRTFSGETIY